MHLLIYTYVYIYVQLVVICAFAPVQMGSEWALPPDTAAATGAAVVIAGNVAELLADSRRLTRE